MPTASRCRSVARQRVRGSIDRLPARPGLRPGGCRAAMSSAPAPPPRPGMSLVAQCGEHRLRRAWRLRPQCQTDNARAACGQPMSTTTSTPSRLNRCKAARMPARRDCTPVAGVIASSRHQAHATQRWRRAALRSCTSASSAGGGRSIAKPTSRASASRPRRAVRRRNRWRSASQARRSRRHGAARWPAGRRRPAPVAGRRARCPPSRSRSTPVPGPASPGGRGRRW